MADRFRQIPILPRNRQGLFLPYSGSSSETEGDADSVSGSSSRAPRERRGVAGGSGISRSSLSDGFVRLFLIRGFFHRLCTQNQFAGSRRIAASNAALMSRVISSTPLLLPPSFNAISSPISTVQRPGATR